MSAARIKKKISDRDGGRHVHKVGICIEIGGGSDDSDYELYLCLHRIFFVQCHEEAICFEIEL